MSSALAWSEVLALMAQACAEAEEERRVLVVLPDRTFHVREVLASERKEEGELLGFVVWKDDPELTRRSDETCLVLVPPGQVQRVEIQGYDAVQGKSFGF